MHLVQDLLTNVQCSGGSRSFAKETRALKMRSAVAGDWKLTKTNWKQLPKLILQLQGKLPKNSVSTILWSFGIWSKLERWKSLVSGSLMNWPQIKKIVILKLFSLILCNNSKPFLNWIVTCNKKWALYYNQWWPTQWLNRERSYKALSKVKLAPKKGSWSLFGDLLPVWSTTAFWIPVKPLHLRSMLSKLMRYTKKSAMSAAGIGQQKGPDFSPWQCPTTHHAANASKVERTGLWICFIHHIHLSSSQLTITSSSISTTFCRENISTMSRRQNMLSMCSLNPEAWIFMLQE